MRVYLYDSFKRTQIINEDGVFSDATNRPVTAGIVSVRDEEKDPSGLAEVVRQSFQRIDASIVVVNPDGDHYGELLKNVGEIARDLPVIALIDADIGTSRYTQAFVDVTEAIPAGESVQHKIMPISPETASHLKAELALLIARHHGVDFDEDDVSFKAGNLTLYPESQKALYRGDDVGFTPVQYRIVQYLALRFEQMARRADLADYSASPNVKSPESLLGVQINQVNKKMKPEFGFNVLSMSQGAPQKYIIGSSHEDARGFY